MPFDALQERKLAVAEAPKALLPFGAGCTAIFAAACAAFSATTESRQLDSVGLHRKRNM